MGFSPGGLRLFQAIDARSAYQCPSSAVTEIAASASTASFQKSRRCLRPGKPSGLISWIAMMARITSDSAFDMPSLINFARACQSASANLLSLQPALGIPAKGCA